MDFLDYENHDLYFDAPLSAEDEALLQKAADAYPSKETALMLQELHSRLPENLIIIVALYRFYYYQHCYREALEIASKALDVSSAKLGLRVDWTELTENHLGMGVFISMGMVRFYMLSLKASAYLLMRTGEIEQAYDRLVKIVELDPADQFGAAFLLQLADKELSIKHAKQHNISSMFNH